MLDRKEPQFDDILDGIDSKKTEPLVSVKKDKKSQPEKSINFFSQYFKPILFLVVVLILAIGYFLFLSPLISDYQELSSSLITAKEKDLQSQQEIYNKLVQADKIYQDTSPYLKDKVLNLLPGQPDLPNLYYNLEQLAMDAKYKLLSFSVHLPEENGKDKVYFVQPAGIEDLNLNKNSVVSPEEIDQLILSQSTNKSKTLNQIGIDVTLSGIGYINFKNFLDFIEHNLRIIDVNLISYDPTEDKIDLSLVTYYYQ